MVAWVGEPLQLDWPLAYPGKLTAWVFEAEGRAGFWHVVGLADYEKASEERWTKKPLPRKAETLILNTVDVVLDWRQSEISFQIVDSIEDGLAIPQFLRDSFIEDARGA